MEKAKKTAFHTPKIFMIIIFLLSFPLIYSVSGQDEKSENNYQKKIAILPAGSMINKEYFAYGNIVEISGAVNGDVYVAGGQVTIDGKINGDLIAVGGTVIISGTISQNVRVAGGNINISGEIGRNVTAAAGTLSIDRHARIHGGLVAGAGSVVLTGSISGNTNIAAGSINISNSIAGDVRAATSHLRVTSKGSVSGNLTYWSDQPPIIEEGAKISGKIIPGRPLELGKASGREFRSAIIFLAFLVKIISFISTLVLGLLLVSLFQGFNKKAINTLKQTPWMSLGAGFVLFFMIPITTFILFLSIFGIPLGFLLGSVYFVFLYLARIPVILWMGIFLSEKVGKAVSYLRAYFIGLLTYFVLGFIPFIGNLVTIAVLFFGSGALILTLRNIYLIPNETK